MNKTSPLWRSARLACALGLGLALASCGGGGDAGGSNGGLPVTGSATVSYVATTSAGSGAAVVIYTKPDGSQGSEAVSLPWKKDFTMKTGNAMLISANQPLAAPADDLVVEIRINSVKKHSNTAKGTATATVAALCCQ